MDQERQRFIESTHTLEKSNMLLEKAAHILRETEEIGMDTATELSRQSSHIKNTKNKIYDIHNETRNSNNILRRIYRKETVIKIIVILFILFLVLIVCSILSFVIYQFYANN